MRTSGGQCFATLIPLGFEIRLAGIERSQHREAALELGPGDTERLLSRQRLAMSLRCFLFESLAAKVGFMRPRAHRFELAEQVRMAAMRGLDAGLHAIPLGFRIDERLPHFGQVSFDATGLVLETAEGRAQRFETMLALDDSRVMIRATADAKPGAPHP